MILFFVPGQPIGKGRPRIGKVGAHARMFTPAKTVNYEGLVAHAASVVMFGNAPLQGACRVRLAITLQIPASWSKRKQERAEAGLEWPTTKPDVDNVIKAIFDAMNGIVWRDDVQACQMAVSKRYGTTPGVTVEVWPLEDAA